MQSISVNKNNICKLLLLLGDLQATYRGFALYPGLGDFRRSPDLYPTNESSWRPTAVAVNTCLGRDTTVVEHQMHSFCFLGLVNVAGVYCVLGYVDDEQWCVQLSSSRVFVLGLITGSHQQLIARSCVDVIRTVMEQPSAVNASTVRAKSASSLKHSVSEFSVGFILLDTIIVV